MLRQQTPPLQQSQRRQPLLPRMLVTLMRKPMALETRTMPQTLMAHQPPVPAMPMVPAVPMVPAMPMVPTTPAMAPALALALAAVTTVCQPRRLRRLQWSGQHGSTAWQPRRWCSS